MGDDDPNAKERRAQASASHVQWDPRYERGGQVRPELASVYHMTGSDEPGYVHWDGKIRPCTPGDEVAAPHMHGDGSVYGGVDHEPIAWPV